jgi:uncharacterized linocin/CFP29 family protein
MDFLKRELAPISDAAWQFITEEAGRALRARLSARRVVHVDGPKGLDHAAIGLGRLTIPEAQPFAGVCFGVHRVLPLVELRASFELDIWELDNADRGAKDIDVQPLLQAANDIAAVEERAVFEGLPEAGIAGMRQAARHAPLGLGLDAASYPDAVARALIVLRDADVRGPFALVLGRQPYRVLDGASGTYPLRKQIEQQLGGPILLATSIEGGFLVATEVDGLQLSLGQDLALCYESHTSQMVKLCLTESFAFRVFDPTIYLPFT